MVDFGANMYAQDDFLKKPIDEMIANAGHHKGESSVQDIEDMYQKAAVGTLRRDTRK